MKLTRTIIYSVIDDGSIRREVMLSDGRAYIHHCSKAVFEAVAHLLDEQRGQGHTGTSVTKLVDAPFTQVDVAFQLLKERGIIEVRRRRQCWATSGTTFEDAMIEYHSLREIGSVTFTDSKSWA